MPRLESAHRILDVPLAHDRIPSAHSILPTAGRLAISLQALSLLLTLSSSRPSSTIFSGAYFPTSGYEQYEDRMSVAGQHVRLTDHACFSSRFCDSL